MIVTIKTETWPIRGHFTISRASLTDVSVVTVEIANGPFTGRGECRPYARYKETCETVMAQIEAIRTVIEVGLNIQELQNYLPPGAARNAVDCALWDLLCKSQARSIWDMLDLTPPKPQPTAYTLSIDHPEAMANMARKALDFTILKLKVDADRMSAQISAVAQIRPACRFIIDANEALTADDVYALAKHPNANQIAMIEQPLHNDIIHDHNFSDYMGPPLCADESFHGEHDLLPLKKLGYKAVNIKLDKCGGLTEALKLIKAAKRYDFQLMGGCMLSTSLAVAPMAAIMDAFDIVDLDGGALLERDRKNGLTYKKGRVYPPSAKLWG